VALTLSNQRMNLDGSSHSFLLSFALLLSLIGQKIVVFLSLVAQLNFVLLE